MIVIMQSLRMEFYWLIPKSNLLYNCLLGVEEMSEVQMQEVDGGFAPLLVAGLIVAGLLISQELH